MEDDDIVRINSLPTEHELTTEIKQKVSAENKLNDVKRCQKLLKAHHKAINSFNNLIATKFDGNYDLDYSKLSVADLKICTHAKYRPDDEPLL